MAGRGAFKLCSGQTLTGTYAITSLMGAFAITEESIATLDIVYTTGASETASALQFYVEYSYDGSTWVKESYQDLVSGVNTLAPVTHKVAGGAGGTAYTSQYLIPLCSRNARVYVEETGVSSNFGTVTIVATVAAGIGMQRNQQETSLSASSITIGKVDQGAAGASAWPVQANAGTNLNTSALALESGGNLADIATDTGSIDGKITACNTGAVVVTTLPTSVQGPGNPTIDSYGHMAINLTTGADQLLVSSAVNKQIWVYGYGFTCGDADGQTVSLQDEDNTAVTGIMEFKQYGGISVSPTGNFAMPLFKLATDKDLEVDITGGDVDGWLCYALVSV